MKSRPTYRALLKDPNATFTHTVPIKARDDASAIKQGQTLALYFEVALWHQERLIKWLPQRKDG